eukprot:scaffold1255_cov120-Isochrysis_galbana.AAC.2
MLVEAAAAAPGMTVGSWTHCRSQVAAPAAAGMATIRPSPLHCPVCARPVHPLPAVAAKLAVQRTVRCRPRHSATPGAPKRVARPQTSKRAVASARTLTAACWLPRRRGVEAGASRVRRPQSADVSTPLLPPACDGRVSSTPGPPLARAQGTGQHAHAENTLSQHSKRGKAAGEHQRPTGTVVHIIDRNYRAGLGLCLRVAGGTAGRRDCNGWTRVEAA